MTTRDEVRLYLGSVFVLSDFVFQAVEEVDYICPFSRH